MLDQFEDATIFNSLHLKSGYPHIWIMAGRMQLLKLARDYSNGWSCPLGYLSCPKNHYGVYESSCSLFYWKCCHRLFLVKFSSIAIKRPILWPTCILFFSFNGPKAFSLLQEKCVFLNNFVILEVCSKRMNFLLTRWRLGWFTPGLTLNLLLIFL